MRTTPASRVPASFVVLALGLLVLLVGCADPHPATEESLDSLVEEHSVPLASGPASPICNPGATRECKIFWYDRDARIHCRLDEQVCRADGYAWLGCGDVDAGVAPDAGTDVDAGED